MAVVKFVQRPRFVKQPLDEGALGNADGVSLIRAGASCMFAVEPGLSIVF